MPGEMADLRPIGGDEAATMEMPVQPGPLPADGAPSPTEIVCIEADKIFDYCFQEVTAQRSVSAPSASVGTSVHCELRSDEATCNIFQTGTGRDDLRTVQMTVTVPAALRIGHEALTVRFVVFKSMQLYAPEGTQIECGVTGTCVGDLVDLNGDGLADEVCCQANLCIVVQSKAAVKLLVPAYGLCVPGPVREGPITPSLPQ